MGPESGTTTRARFRTQNQPQEGEAPLWGFTLLRLVLGPESGAFLRAVRVLRDRGVLESAVAVALGPWRRSSGCQQVWRSRRGVLAEILGRSACRDCVRPCGDHRRARCWRGRALAFCGNWCPAAVSQCFAPRLRKKTCYVVACVCVVGCSWRARRRWRTTSIFFVLPSTRSRFWTTVEGPPKTGIPS